MPLPTRPKHIPKPQKPVGWIKDGKMKVQDGDTGKMGWRGVRRGLLRDFDGDPISTRHNVKNAKVPHSHTTHMGNKKAHTTVRDDE